MNGSRLKHLRKEKNVKIDDIINYCNISMSYYYQLERGEKRLNEDVLNLLADYFKVSTDYILGRTDEPNISVLKDNDLPYKLQGKVDAIHIVDEVLEKGISKETIEEILQFIDKLKKK